MQWDKSVQLMRRYAKCENCGNDQVGNGQGSVEITDNTFRRTCKCGWKVEIEVGQPQTRKQGVTHDNQR